ncbi:MAG: metallophosphoesterase [Pyrinomonadaceae bacterium]
MKHVEAETTKFSERMRDAVSSNTPLRSLASNFSKTARNALNEANALEIEEVNIALERLPKKLDGLQIVQLSDIHHSPFTDLNHIERAIEITNELEPDLVLLTGDYVSHDAAYIAPVAKALGRLEPKYGSFACLGNHDHWTDAEQTVRALTKEGITVFVNSGERFTANDASIWLCGVDDYQAGKTDIAAALRGSYEDEMKILLAHNPVILRQAVKFDIDLIFSGHTHGGQVKLRENENKRLGKRRLSNGLHHRKDTQIYITRGIGTVVLPVRFQCPPEISQIKLRCKS